MVDFTRLSTFLQFLEPEAGQEAKSDRGTSPLPPAATMEAETGRNGVLWCGWLMLHSQALVMKAADLGARFWLYEQEAGMAKCSP